MVMFPKALSEPPADPCERCPGGPDCWLLHMRARSAHVKGCRHQVAKDANTEYIRENRAQKRAQGLTGPGKTWGPDEPVPEPELAGIDCPECGEPVSWAPGRAGMICPAGHFLLPPETAERAADAIRERVRAVREVTEPGRESGPSVSDTVALAAEAGRIIRMCENSLVDLDTSQLDDWRARGYLNGARGWNDDSLADVRARLAELIRLARHARSADTLREIEKEYHETAGRIGTLVMLIKQEFRNVADNLTYRAQGTQFRVLPGGNRIVPVTEPGSQQWQIPPVPDRKMITAYAEPAGSDDYGDDEYDDDEYDDDDKEPRSRYRVTNDYDSSGRRIIYDDNVPPMNTKAALYLCGFVAVLVIGVWGYFTVTEWWNRDEFIVCQNPEHYGRPALARERFKGYRESIDVCERPQCREYGHAKVTIPGYQEPQSFYIVDANGTPGFEITGKGKYRKVRGFGGARNT